MKVFLSLIVSLSIWCGGEERTSGDLSGANDTEPAPVSVVGTLMTINDSNQCIVASDVQKFFEELPANTVCPTAIVYWIEEATGDCYAFGACWPTSGFRQEEGGTTGCGLPTCD